MPSAGTALCSVVCALPHSAISALKGNGNWIWERSGTELEVDFICPQPFAPVAALFAPRRTGNEMRGQFRQGLLQGCL